MSLDFYRTPVEFSAPGRHARLFEGLPHDIGSLGGETIARGIGPDGNVVGRSVNRSGRQRAFRYSAGVMRDLGGGSTNVLLQEDAIATNYWGDVVGVESAGSTNLTPTAVRYQDGGAYRMASAVLSPFGFVKVEHVVDLNDSRMVLGALTVGGNITTLVSNNLGYQWTVLKGVPGLSFSTFPAAMNRLGHVTGTAGQGVVRAFLSRDPTLDAIDLGTLGGSDSFGEGINSYDWVVGASALATTELRAFVHDGTGMFDLNSRVWNGTGWLLLEATGVNDSGVIVGNGFKNGVPHAFMLLPMARSPLTPPCQIVGNTGGIATR